MKTNIFKMRVTVSFVMYQPYRGMLKFMNFVQNMAPFYTDVDTNFPLKCSKVTLTFMVLLNLSPSSWQATRHGSLIPLFTWMVIPPNSPSLCTTMKIRHKPSCLLKMTNGSKRQVIATGERMCETLRPGIHKRYNKRTRNTCYAFKQFVAYRSLLLILICFFYLSSIYNLYSAFKNS